MAENEQLSDIEELHSPLKNEVAEREYTPPPRQKKHKIKRRPTHRATCPKNPSRRLIFSSQDEQDPSPTRHCTKKKRKMKRRKSGRSKKQKFTGRDIEVSGTWVQCTNKDCMKWRYLSDITDPSHVPDVWTCEMNSDSSYNSCLLPEQDYSSLEFVHSKFTEGSLVWARMQGFPWWPAMIEEDPDSELCLYPDPVTGYVTDYHVIFLDKKVTRCWLKVSNIQKYEGGESPGSMMIKGRDYSNAIKAAKDVADEALKLPIKERIKTFGFSARFKGPWGEEEHRTSDESQHSESHKKKKGPKPQKRIIIDEEDSSLAGSLLSHSDMDDILDEAEALLGEVQNIVMEVEDEVQESLLQEMEKDENGSPSLKRKAEMAESDEPPMKQKKMSGAEGSSKQELSEDKAVRAPKEKLSSEMRMSKELERIQKKKEKEMHKLELRELKEREKIEKREKERQAKKDQKAKEKLEKEEKKKREKEEEKEKQEKEKQELKEKAKQEKKERKHKEKQAKKELKKKEKAEKKALEGEAKPAAEGQEKEDDAEKAARKEKKRLEKDEKKKLKKEMKAKRKEEKKEGNEGKATKPKGTEKVKPSFQKPKKPTFSAPKPKSVETPLAHPIQPTPAEESSVSKEIGALINEIVSDKNQTSEVANEPITTTVASPVVSAVVPANLPATQTSPAKNIKKHFKPKFSIKTKDGASLSESNLPDKKTSSPPPPVLTAEDGLNALDEETSVDIAKILEVNANQDSQKTTEAESVKENNSDPLAFPLSEMTGNQLELLPKLDPQEDSTKVEDPRQESLHIKEPKIDDAVKMDDVISESKNILKTLDQLEIEEFSPESTDWSEPDEPQTVPGQKTVMVAPPAATCMEADSDDSEPFDMEE